MADVPTPETVIAVVADAFAATTRPPDPFLVGSRDGCEPAESVAPFHGKDWRELPADLLDANYTALSFFSEGGFRYFLPAYLVADVRRQLRTANPAFHLTHGLHGFSHTRMVGGESWTRHYGGDVLLNPRRYGAITSRDHARFRLSVFSREASGAIVAYLRWRAADDEDERTAIATALETFWLERARVAPLSADLERHLAEEARFDEAVLRRRDSGE